MPYKWLRRRGFRVGGAGIKFWLGRIELFFRQVPKISAGRLLVCMVGSRFLKSPYKIVFRKKFWGTRTLPSEIGPQVGSVGT